MRVVAVLVNDVLQEEAYHFTSHACRPAIRDSWPPVASPTYA
jgi:hypothetical protein